MREIKVVFTTGVFDLLHHGHIKFLNRAKDLGHLLIVGLVDDDSVKVQKGLDRPVLPWEERKDLLLSLRSVNDVVIQVGFDPTSLLETLGVEIDIIAKGKDQDHVSETYAREHGIEIVYLDRTKGVSTSEIINASRK